MDDLPELFPGFRAERIEGEGATIFVRIGGSGAPLLLLHGYPQTHACWHRIAGEMARHFTLVIPDLRGYGASEAPASDPEHRTYSKRAMAADMVALMGKLGFERFALVGHDRGGRVGYRLALDHPARLVRLALLDIIPTLEMWERTDANRAHASYHWTFLAQPHPMPETLITPNAIAYLEYTLASWTKEKSLAAFDPRALQHYRAYFADPVRIHAACEDYRAGWTIDRMLDAADRREGKRIACPVLALWGSAGIPTEADAPLAIWRDWAQRADGTAISSGHFLAEENPEATLAALVPFLMAEAAA